MSVPEPMTHLGVTDGQAADIRSLLADRNVNDRSAILVPGNEPGLRDARAFEVRLAGHPIGFEWFVAVCDADGAYVAGPVRR